MTAKWTSRKCKDCFQSCGEDSRPGSLQSMSGRDSASEIIVDASERINIDPNEFIKRLEQEKIRFEWQLQYMDSYQWHVMDFPIGLVASIRRILDERIGLRRESQNQTTYEARDITFVPPHGSASSSASALQTVLKDEHEADRQRTIQMIKDVVPGEQAGMMAPSMPMRRISQDYYGTVQSPPLGFRDHISSLRGVSPLSSRDLIPDGVIMSSEPPNLPKRISSVLDVDDTRKK